MKKMYVMAAVLMLGAAMTAKAAEPVARLDEVVVTATRTEEKLRDVSNAVIIKDFFDIEESSARSVGELLANEPGVDWRTRGNYGGASEEIQIRGMGGDATQVLLNGVSVNSPSLGSADVGRLPLNSIEKVEVVKGAGSLLYGTGAMGGTVNILTKNPQRDRTALKAGAGFGSEGTHEVNAEQGMFLDDAFGYYLTVTGQETDGFRENSDLDHRDASVKLLYDKGDRLQVSMFGAYVDREYGVPGVRPPAGTQDYFVNGVRMYGGDAASLVDHGSDEDIYSVLELKSRPLGWLAVTLRGDYVEMENYYYRRNNGAVWPKVAGEGEETWVTNTVLGAEGFVELRPTAAATLLVGAQYKDYEYKNEVGDLDSFGSPVAGTITSDVHDLFTRGAYAEAEYRFCPALKVLAGVRHEKHSMFGYENLPRYGAVIQPFDATTVKVNRGKHFKAPTMNDLYWPDNGWVRGNPGLQPEVGWHSDVSVDQELWRNRLTLSATYFEWNIDDKISWAENPAFPTVIPGINYWTPSNVDTYEAKGWELGLQGRPVDALRVGLSYTHTDAEEEKSVAAWRQALYTAKHLFKGEVGYTLDFGLTAGMTVRYVGDRPAYYPTAAAITPQYTLASYWITDVMLSQRWQNHWLVALQLNNIFDQGYDTYLASFRDENTATTSRQGYPGAGRSAFLSVTYEF